jgi:SOS-response transcriptional repressor LexA
MLWPRESSPRWIGQENALEESSNPAVITMPNPLVQSVQMIHLFGHRSWGNGRHVAIVGEVAAGRFDVTVAYHEGGDQLLTVPVDGLPLNCFALRVRGSSMQDAGIQHGDYVLVRPQSMADNGELVIAAQADSEDPEGYVTLKQFFKENGRIRLQPANAAMAPIHLYPEYGRDPVQIQGKVVAIVRLMSD